MNEIKKDNLTKICIFLKMLHDDTKTKESKLNLGKIMRSLEIPYYYILPTILLKRGIVTVKGSKKGYKYVWSTTTEPNHIMATALMRECCAYYNDHHRNIQLWPLNINQIGLLY